jgi:hypothetical protein
MTTARKGTETGLSVGSPYNISKSTVVVSKWRGKETLFSRKGAKAAKNAELSLRVLCGFAPLREISF